MISISSSAIRLQRRSSLAVIASVGLLILTMALGLKATAAQAQATYEYDIVWSNTSLPPGSDARTGSVTFTDPSDPLGSVTSFTFNDGGSVYTRDSVDLFAFNGNFSGSGEEVGSLNDLNFRSDDGRWVGVMPNTLLLRDTHEEFRITSFIGTTITAPPTPVLAGPADPQNGPFTVTATFSEAVTGFDASDVVATNGTISNFSGSGASYSFDVAPTSDGQVTVEIPAAVAQNAGGVLNTASDRFSLTADLTAPTIDLAGPFGPQSGPFTVTATFSEAVTGFDLSDVVVSNGTAGNFSGSGASYSFEIIPSSDGQVTVDVAAAAAQDVAGMDSVEATQFAVVADLSGPNVGLDGPSGPQSGPFTVTVTFSEAVTGFDLADVVVTNGTTSSLSGSGGSYSFDVTPLGEGQVTLDITAHVAQDSSGNYNAAARQLVVETDLAGPSLELTGPSGMQAGPFTVAASFSEAVSGFELSDIAVTNGAASDLSGSGASYSFVVTPAGGGQVSVAVAADAAQDAAGNSNMAARLTVEVASPALEFARVRDEVTTVVQEEAVGDIRGIIGADRRFLRSVRNRFVAERSGADVSRNVPFDVDGTADVVDGMFSTKGAFFGQTASADGTYRRLVFGDFEARRDSTDTVTARLTAKLAWERQVGSDALIGYFVGGEVSHSDIEQELEGNRDSYAASVGAYGVAELRPGLFLDGTASASFGRSDLELGDATIEVDGSYDTRIIAFGGTLSGAIDRGAYEFRPQLAFSYGYAEIGSVDLTARAFGTSEAVSLDAGHISLASLSVTPEFWVPVEWSAMRGADTALTIAPKLFCDAIVADDHDEECGGGGRFGVRSVSRDGLIAFDAEIDMERAGGVTRQTLRFKFEASF